MSFKDCISAKVKAGELNEELANQVINEFEESLTTSDPRTAYLDLADKKKKQMERVAKNLVRHNEIKAEIVKGFDSFNEERDMVNYVRKKNLMANSQAEVELNNFQKVLNDGLDGGLKNQSREDVLEAVTAILDKREASTPQAKLIKDNIQKSLKFAKNEADALGIIMGDLGDSYIPRSWNRQKIRAMSMDEWVNGLIDKVDFQGRSRAQMEEFLRLSKLEIQTNGRLSALELKQLEGEADFTSKSSLEGTEVQFKRNHSRQIHFKDSKSHFEAMEFAGYGKDSFTSDLQKYFFSMSKDLGTARVLGPTPRKLLKELQTEAALRKERRMISDYEYKPKNSERAKKLLEAEFNIMQGTSFDGDRDSPLYRMFVGSQLWMRASHLGSAVVSAIPDTNFSAMTNLTNGGSFLKPFKDYFKFFSGLGRKELTDLAEEMGYLTEIFGGTLFDEARFSIVGDSDGAALGKLRKINDFTFKASGLNAWTKGGKIIAQINANITLSKHIKNKKAWGDLGLALRERLETSGINEAKWSRILEEVEVKEGRASFFNADDLRVKDPLNKNGLYDLAEDLDRFVFDMQNLVVNENNVTTRAITSGAYFGGGRVGTAGKMFSESIFQYKNFPITVMINHLFPAIRRASQDKRHLGEVGALVVGTGLMALIPLQIKELLKGRTFKEITPELLAASLAQGGGAGILGDFLFQDTSRFGASMTATLAGPYVSTAESFYETFYANPKDRAIGTRKSGSFQEDIVKLARRNTPVLSSLWYTRLAVERLLFDSLQEFVDPKYKKNIKRQKQRINKLGQRFWWEPSEKRPDTKALADAITLNE